MQQALCQKTLFSTYKTEREGEKEEEREGVHAPYTLPHQSSCQFDVESTKHYD